MKNTTEKSYRKRLIDVVDYIYQHIDGDLDVNTLAEVAHLSPYHFHRIYREIAQETINVSVRRLRLQQAASDLIRTEKPLLQIARDVAYGSLEAFSRAFNKEFGESPKEFRTRQKAIAATHRPFVAMLPHEQKEFIAMYDVEISDFEGLSLVGYEHKGDYMQIGKEFSNLYHYASTKSLINDTTRSIGIYYHDPKSVEDSELRSAACISVQGGLSLEEENAPKTMEIPAGKCVSLLFKGSYAELENPYDWLFGQWLPQSGYEAADFPPFEEYLNDPKDTPPNELLTKIHCLLA